jgi:hypothetical protein
MTLVYQALVSIAFLGMILTQAFVVIELRRLRRGLPKLLDGGPGPVWAHTSSFLQAWTGVTGSQGGYAIYVYRGGRWVLESDLSAPGFAPSAPGLEGAYEGQVIKKESAPVPGR